MIPSEIIADTTVEFAITPDERMPVDGYLYSFRLGGASSLSKSGTVSGEDVTFKISPADTASFTSGLYSYQIFATKGDDKYLIASGRIGVSAAIAGTGAFDGRTVAERIVANIDAVLEGRATSDQQSYSIQSGSGARSLSRIPVLELKELRKHYASIVAQEQRAKNGESLFKAHKIAFVCD